MFGVCVWLIGIDEVSMILMSWCEFLMWVWYELDDKKYDFDKVVLFVD